MAESNVSKSGDNDNKDVKENRPPRNQQPPKSAKVPPEAVYDVAALTEGTTSWEQFDYPPELVAAALKLAKKDRCTLREAREIIKEFAEREVK